MSWGVFQNLLYFFMYISQNYEMRLNFLVTFVTQNLLADIISLNFNFVTCIYILHVHLNTIVKLFQIIFTLAILSNFSNNP